MRCIRCMKEIEDGQQVCGFCNFAQDTPPEYPDALAPGTELRNRFVLGRELGRGGFGITYVGYDKYLDCKVAIKEYYPQSLAARLPSENKIFWRNKQMQTAGCQNVIREAQKMHRIGVLTVAVHVLDVFYENNTAYIAMDFVEGITLKQYLLKNGVLSVEKCMELMIPILDTMIQMHDAGIIHRDISPDNIMIQPDMQPRILDLGAAKDIQTTSGNTTLVAKNGFSPMEQYQTEGIFGTWTDVYALCATMYYSLTGKLPPAALDRSNDELPLLTTSNLPAELCRVLRDGMRMSVDRRIPNVTELKNRLEASMKPVCVPDKEPVHATDTAAGHDTGNSHVTGAAAVHDTRNSHITGTEGAARTDAHAVQVSAQEKPKGFFAALRSMFGKKKSGAVAAGQKQIERKPMKVAVLHHDAAPVYVSLEAAACSGADEEETVLIGAEPSLAANGVLVQNSTGKRIGITKCCFVLGRLTNAAGAHAPVDCMIEDRTKHISRLHAVILFDGEAFYLQDISGKNRLTAEAFYAQAL